nr:permease [Methanococcus vannielii]
MNVSTIINIAIETLIDYLNVNRIIALFIAFFMAGGIASMINKNFILKYFGPKTPKHISYIVASVSGCLLAVCSCTIIPLFAGIYKRGAGIGPATTFLFSGPAINVLAIFYSAALLGWSLGIFRTISAVFLSIVIGLSMALLFKDEKNNKNFRIGVEESISTRRGYQTSIFFLVQLIMLIIITASQTLIPFLSLSIYGGFLLKHLLTVILTATLVIITKNWFSNDELKLWFKETYSLMKLVVPLLLLGVIIAGILKSVIPQEIIKNYVGGNYISSNLTASIIGTLMYFSTLTEVPIVKSLMELGMGFGPATALLLSGPSLSIPSILVISRVIGNKKTLVYSLLVVIFSTIAGIFAGKFL